LTLTWVGRERATTTGSKSKTITESVSMKDREWKRTHVRMYACVFIGKYANEKLTIGFS